MRTGNKTRAPLGVLTAALVTLAATGCTATTPTHEVSEGPAEVFAGCLESHGVDSMRMGDHLLVRNEVADASLELVVTDGLMHWFDEGLWVAVRGAQDLVDLPALKAAYAACEVEVPEFSNPDRVVSVRGRDQLTRESVYLEMTAFSRCVEGLGFDWFDTSSGMPTGLQIPPRLDPDVLRETFTLCPLEHPQVWVGCYDEENPELCGPLWEVMYTAPLSPLFGLGSPA